jgi:glycosyltransferase involved in cell wall biosynthesis
MREHVGIAEVVFVDNSVDDTRWVIQQVAAGSTVPASLLRRRPRERTGGLSGAVADGILAASQLDGPRHSRGHDAQQARDANLEPAPVQPSTEP